MTSIRLRKETRWALIARHGISPVAIKRAETNMSRQIYLAIPKNGKEFHAYYTLRLPIDGEMKMVLFDVGDFEDVEPAQRDGQEDNDE